MIDLDALETVSDLAQVMNLDEARLTAFIKSQNKFVRKIVIPRHRESNRPRIAWEITDHKLKAGFQTLHETLAEHFQETRQSTFPHPSAHGFIAGRSALTNAKQHPNTHQLLKFDIKNFFDSINRSTIERELAKQGLTPKAARLVARICCPGRRLPTGYPTSPLLSNIVATPIDEQLSSLASDYRARYTRYADDLSFSSATSETELPTTAEIAGILRTLGFRLNKDKTRRRTLGQSLLVTGYNVEGPSARIPKATKRRIRAWIHIAKKGLRALSKRTGIPSTVLQTQIPGTIAFISAAEPEVGARLLSDWSTATAKEPQPRRLTTRRRRPEEITLVFDDTAFDFGTTKYAAIGVARVRDAEDCASELRSIAKQMRLNPFNTKKTQKTLRDSGLHYTELPEDLRRDCAQLLARLPALTHVAFAELTQGQKKKLLLQHLLQSALQARLRDCADKSVTVLFEQGEYIKSNSAGALVEQAMKLLPEDARPTRISDVRVVSKEEPLTWIPDIVMGIWQHYAQSSLSEHAPHKDRFRRLFDLIRRKTPTIYDLQSKQLFNTKHPFPPFPAPETSQPHAEPPVHVASSDTP